jgi:hypothetical protein
MNNKAKRVVIFFNVSTNGYLIQVVGSNNEVLHKIDSLPTMCNLSDLYVEVIKVDEYEEEDENIFIINNILKFDINKGIVNYLGPYPEEDVLSDITYMKQAFNISI